MQVGDRLDERQAKTGAFGRPARIEAAEALKRVASPLFGNTRTTVRDTDGDLSVLAAGEDRNLASAGAVADRILDKVADSLCNQLPVTEKGEGVFGPFETE